MIKSQSILFIVATCFFFSAAFGQRDTININADWQFKTDKESRGFQQQWFGKSLKNTHTVKLPHTWNIDSVNQNFYGWSWYQKAIDVPKSWANKNVVLQFGAANHTSVIYLNGKEIGENTGDGFDKFFVDLTGKLNPGMENRITVAVNNDYGKNKVPYANSFDWPNDGGLIRPVKLIVSGRPAARYIHITPTLDPNNKNGTIETALGFDFKSRISFRVTITEENQPTSKVVYSETIEPVWKGNEATFSLKLNDIHPWHFDFPNLYKVDVTVLKNNKPVDRLAANTGFRTVAFHHGKTYLNGERVKLMGIEWTAGSNPDFGFAEPDSQIIAMGKLMKNVNAIFSRQHFQQGDVFYDFCDRNGILVQQEVPLWGGETPGNDTIQRIALRQLHTMITNLYNHPSIFAWGMGNELRARDADIKRMIETMMDSARVLDPHRHAAYVSNTIHSSFYNSPGFVPDAASDGDFIMMNEYGGSWWSVPSGAIGKYLDSVHLTYPSMPFFISEFGLCEPNFKGGDERRIQDMIYHMSLYESKPYIEGAIYFDLTDYRTHYPGTHDNDKYRRRIHGVYDMFGNPKPSMKVLREMSSPVELLGLHNWKQGKLNVLVFCSEGLPQHAIRGYKLYLSDREDNYKSTRAYDIPELQPGQRAYIEVDDLYKGNGIITVERPNGYIVSQKSFY